MECYEEVKQELIQLERSGEVVDTPSLCREMSLKFGLDHTTIFNLLVEIRCSPRSRLKESRPVGRPRKKLSEDEVSSLLELLCRSASDYGYHSPLWTPQRVIKSAGVELGLVLKKDLVWANLKRWGLTFEEQLRQCLGGRGIPAECSELLKKKRGLLYVLTELHSAELGVVALVGLTSSKKTPLGCAVWQRHRIMTDLVKYFLRGLLTLHPERHLAVLMRQKSAYRTEKLKQLESYHRRLHLFLVD
ncbi:MAG: hypothetical protein F6J86_06820 [Symploca sp. SIO1B1]|nr:hypothetical protein [Symploca sp. SIO1B1]